MKSAPANIANQLARRTLSRVWSSPVSKITFKCALEPSVRRQAAFTWTISSNTCPIRPDRNAPRSITMSISSAPAATASSVSASFTRILARPEGKAVATAATATPEGSCRI
ncbi:MAG: Uncharacterised protein [Cellulomonadaceae bacterium TMED98]|nr:MAG: Uncharacterised protein [Cellulomonadaceae bacterium TMED98]